MFELAIFTDDIDQNLDHALDVIEELDVSWVEIRSAWGQNLVHHSGQKIEEIRRAIHNRGMRVACIAAPLFKSRLQGRGKADEELFFAEEQDDMAQQLAILRRSAELARLFDTDLVRCFSFWRIDDDPTALWPDLLESFAPAVRLAEAEGITLVMENDYGCNLGGGAESARFIEQIGSPHLRLLWDPGNAYFVGETPYPDGYEAGKHVVGHVHVKDAVFDPPSGTYHWVALGSGEVDLTGQLRALKADGYSGVVSMENHFTPTAGTKEDGVRQSFAGLKRLIAEMN
jgi:sugar phosphate isomerase/epimerase